MLTIRCDNPNFLEDFLWLDTLAVFRHVALAECLVLFWLHGLLVNFKVILVLVTPGLESHTETTVASLTDLTVGN